MEDICREYITLALEIDTHEEGYVDAYYGKEELREEAKRRNRTLDQIQTDVTLLLDKISNSSLQVDERRRTYLKKQVLSFLFTSFSFLFFFFFFSFFLFSFFFFLLFLFLSLSLLFLHHSISWFFFWILVRLH